MPLMMVIGAFCTMARTAATPGDKRVIDAAADQRGHGRRPAADQNGSDIQTFGGKEAEFLSDKEGQRAAQCRRVRREVDDLGGRDARAGAKPRTTRRLPQAATRGRPMTGTSAVRRFFERNRFRMILIGPACSPRTALRSWAFSRSVPARGKSRRAFPATSDWP